jgi:galactose mutarotase-like enzyme
MIITISNTTFSAAIDTLGAELISLNSKSKNYIWTVDETYWNKTSPILFPIVGRLKNDTFTYQDKSYNLPRHGFARNFDFKIVSQTENFVSLSLVSSRETLLLFPFDFELLLNYKLTENGLEITYAVYNKSEDSMPFSIGAHPAFAIDHPFSEYSLVFNETETLISHQLNNEQFDNSVREIESNKGEIKLDYLHFEKDALVFKHLKSDEITLKHNNEFVLKVLYEGFPYIGLWTKPNAPFLCIEPWCGLADNTNHNGNLIEKEGINFIEKEDLFQRKITIQLLQ